MRPTEAMLPPGTTLVRAEVRGFDPDRRSVETTAGRFGGDAVLVALGASSTPSASPGFAEAAHNIYTVEGANGCAAALDSFRGGRVVVVVAGLPYKCPAAPYEAALLIDDELRRRGIRGASEIDVYSPEPAPMPVAGPTMGDAVVGLLRSRSIRFHPGSATARFEPASRELVLTDGTRVPYDLLVGIPPHRPPTTLAGSGIVNEAGWVPVDRSTLATPIEGVHAVGDATTITLANGRPLPKAGVFAHAQALVAARQIAARLAGTTSDERFRGHGYCWVETGRGHAAFATGDFYAEPDPTIALHRPNGPLHLGKVLFERSWLAGGLERRLAVGAIRVGSRLLRIDAEV